MPHIDIMAAIKAMYPAASPADTRAALTPEFLKEAYGKLPPYSSLDAPNLHPVKTATVGSFVICHGADTSIDRFAEPVLILIQRSDKGPAGEPRYGVTGGYTELGGQHSAGEQPNEGAVRELKEELITDQGNPVIDPRPDRLKLIANGVDYKSTSLPTNYNGFSLELTLLELTKVKKHAAKMQNDPVYRAAVREKSNGEVMDLQVMPISAFAKMKKEDFTYPHEFKAVHELCATLKKQQVASLRSAL